jgi:hypothetical protein
MLFLTELKILIIVTSLLNPLNPKGFFIYHQD